MFNTAHLNPLEWLAAIILVIGGINWGLVGIFEFDVVAEVFGEEYGTTETGPSIVYIIVGIAALYTLLGLLRMEAMTYKTERDTSSRMAQR